MRAQQVEEERKNESKMNRILWILYVVFMGWVCVLAIIRIVSLFRRITWRVDVKEANDFPSGCGSWAVEKGCTRVTLEAGDCVRAKDISTDNSLIFDVNNVDRLLNT